MNISSNQKKTTIVERLLKDGAIDFTEALELMQEQIVFHPTTQPYTWWPVSANPTWTVDLQNNTGTTYDFGGANIAGCTTTNVK